MKRTILMSILAIAACGGGKKSESTTPKDPEPEAAAAESKPAPDPDPAPAPEAPAPTKSWHAQAELQPVKGAKIKGTTVTFSQDEGAEVVVGSNGWFDGIKPGKYHLVVHDGADCGTNAAKAGKPMATADMPLNAAKGQDSVDVGKVSTIQLNGDGAIIGHTLVLHADVRGKPGKPLACGAIANIGGDS
ncbi:MAG TPA: superoxide dismutase family protein [Kofleriaceae bacterium]|jgi:hypothetical protein|nr:superoxide dismutase family protein [Kofleriaceae bacterium]